MTKNAEAQQDATWITRSSGRVAKMLGVLDEGPRDSDMGWRRQWPKIQEHPDDGDVSLAELRSLEEEN